MLVREWKDYEKIIANHIPDKGLAFRIYKEFSKLSKKNDLIKNGQNNETEFSKDTHVANKSMGRNILSY